jgi:hypothetical protein
VPVAWSRRTQRRHSLLSLNKRGKMLAAVTVEDVDSQRQFIICKALPENGRSESHRPSHPLTHAHLTTPKETTECKLNIHSSITEK